MKKLYANLALGGLFISLPFLSYANDINKGLPPSVDMLNLNNMSSSQPVLNSALTPSTKIDSNSQQPVKKLRKKKKINEESVNYINLRNSEQGFEKIEHITLERYKQIKNIVRKNSDNILFIQNKATYLVEVFNYKDKLIHTLKIQPAYQTRAEDTTEIPYIAICMKEGSKVYNDYEILETGLILETGFSDPKKVDRFLSVDFSFLWKMEQANTGDCMIDIPKVSEKKFIVDLPLILYEEQTMMKVRDYRSRLFKFKVTRLK